MRGAILCARWFVAHSSVALAVAAARLQPLSRCRRRPCALAHALPPATTASASATAASTSATTAAPAAAPFIPSLLRPVPHPFPRPSPRRASAAAVTRCVRSAHSPAAVPSVLTTDCASCGAAASLLIAGARVMLCVAAFHLPAPLPSPPLRNAFHSTVLLAVRQTRSFQLFLLCLCPPLRASAEC
jgi:hypothetical protein